MSRAARAPVRFPCSCGCGRRLARSTLYMHTRLTRAAADLRHRNDQSWMTAEQTPTRPAPWQNRLRPLSYGEFMPSPQTWDEYQAERGQDGQGG